MNTGSPARPPSGSRAYRLTGTGAFETVFRDGTRFDGRQVQIIAMPAALPLGRFGLVVGRKALPRAIDRNRFKRLVRQAFRSARAETVALDVVVRVRSPLKRADVDDAAHEASTLLARAVTALTPRRAP